MGQCKTPEMFRAERENSLALVRTFRTAHITLCSILETHMTLTWPCLEDPTHNIVTSIVMIMK